MPLANQWDRRPERANVPPEPSWWNMAIPIIIVVVGVRLGIPRRDVADGGRCAPTFSDHTAIGLLV